ncbi:phosphotransferase enzyme family protein [uncultured Jatrophihabitans sp.]|uniref:phosphotransferase enzyme family protein n=1 Tax=uncultured Jatrophihabitans sp. TaxID=1610747 RepID=UPI0035CA1FAD
MSSPKQLADTALQRYDLADARLTFLAASFNTVYRVDARAASYVLHVGPALCIHHPDVAAAQDRWTRHLEARGVPVPRVVRTRDGAPSTRVGTATGTHECTVTTWVPGVPLATPPSPADVRGLGTLSARLHDATDPVGTAPAGALTWRSVLQFELADRLGALPAPSRDVLRNAHTRAQSAVDRLWRQASTPPRLVHTDLTPANLVRDGDTVHALDFQDMAWGHVEQDLANTLYGLTRGHDAPETLAALRDGYEQVRPWPRLDPGLLPDLFAARRLAIVNLAVHRRRPDLDAYVRRHVDALRDHAD